MSLGAVLALAGGGCARTPHTRPGTIRVEAAFAPLAFIAERIGGPYVTVHDLTPSGAEPHDIELKASQVQAVRTAALAVYLKGFQPALDAVVPRGALDLTTAVPFVHGDPHVWLDPRLMVLLAGPVAERLALLLPEHARDVGARAVALLDDLHALDRDFRAGLADCARHDVVTSHAAFGYLARRYGLTQVAIAGLNPDEEPTAHRLTAVARLVRERHVTTVFFETLVSPKLARTLARETHARAAVLDPAEGGSDYLAAMRANLAALRSALGCR